MSGGLCRPRAILFDWDNTLVDSWECIRVATNATLRHMGHPEWSMEETRRRVALSLRDSFPKMFGDRWTEARDHFYATFRAIHLDYLKPLPGAPEMIEALAGEGIWLGVVSNKNGAFLRAEADRLGWSRHFRRLVGATDAARDKPWPEPVLMALEGSGIAPGTDVWFVGDAPIDMQCAAQSGCLPLLLRAEPAAEDEFGAYRPGHHCARCSDLVGLVRELGVPIWPN